MHILNLQNVIEHKEQFLSLLENILCVFLMKNYFFSFINQDKYLKHKWYFILLVLPKIKQIYRPFHCYRLYVMQTSLIYFSRIAIRQNLSSFQIASITFIFNGNHFFYFVLKNYCALLNKWVLFIHHCMICQNFRCFLYQSKNYLQTYPTVKIKKLICIEIQ